MCRNIRTLFNFEPPATDEEIRASALQFARKLSGFARPSRANEAAFDRAVDEFSDVARRFLESLDASDRRATGRSRRSRPGRGRERGSRSRGSRAIRTRTHVRARRSEGARRTPVHLRIVTRRFHAIAWARRLAARWSPLKYSPEARSDVAHARRNRQ